MSRPPPLHLVPPAEPEPNRAASLRAELAQIEAEQAYELIKALEAARDKAEAIAAENSLSKPGVREFARTAAVSLTSMIQTLSAIVGRA